MKYYLAYGSNLDIKHMTSMCPQARFLGIIKQEGYKLAFRGQKFRSYLTVLKDPKHHIFLGIYQINDDCEISS